mmetsp:Transcript_40642/g.135433  ORF Transcript_40642/g.135433 Transcript_40642/m.135433 type:complete len:216 (-) Transcript_40642:651-1298(-)
MPSRAAEASVGLSKLRLGASPAELATGGSLRELGTFYGTDKATLTNFVDVYAEVLPHGAERWQVRSVLEIGVFFGASIKMWRDFYPNATIYGIDAFKGIEGYKFHGKHQKFPHPRAFLESWQRGDQGARIELIQADENIDAEMDHARRMLRALLRNSSRLTGEPKRGLPTPWSTLVHAQPCPHSPLVHAQPCPHSPACTALPAQPSPHAQPRGDV